MRKDVIIACDFANESQLFEFLNVFEEKPFLKIGMELFYKEGPQLIKKLKEQEYKIFLDLKLHDIPNTVYKAMKIIATLGVDITNVHAAGGVKMMAEAKRGLIEGSLENHITKLIAVTQLTSINEQILQQELLINTNLPSTVRKYAENAKKAGLDGVVCSVLEAPIMKELDLISVTPGIRFLDDDNEDQKRVATPKYAKKLGSDYIVVGRSITTSSNPYEAYLKCKKEFN